LCPPHWATRRLLNNQQQSQPIYCMFGASFSTSIQGIAGVSWIAE
jgi:hypothetical protein